MIWFIKQWFIKLSAVSKILLFLLIASIFFGLYKSAKLARTEYLFYKEMKKSYIRLSKEVDDSELKEVEIIKEAVIGNKKAKSKNKEINDKLKSDEKIIDDSNITDVDRQKFLSKYENQR
jgi:Sec-independent protein translocase protein TatA